MTLSIYQIDAFTNKLFGGNPAAIIPLKEWISDELMQKIAAENNLSETAYYVKSENGFSIRWFTPSIEVNLCGHATLAAAYVIFNIEKNPTDTIHFDSKSGILKVQKKDSWLELDFPKQEISKAEAPEGLIEGIGHTPTEIYRAVDDYVLVFRNEKEIANLQPNHHLLKQVKARGIVVTAPAKSKKLDFVSRFFAPGSGIDEDPVTGSAHTKLVPYWSNKLGKTELVAEQISIRRGFLKCKLDGNRVLMAGQAKLYLKGKVRV